MVALTHGAGQRVDIHQMEKSEVTVVDKAFIEQVERALNLVRKKDYKALGQLEISKHPPIDAFLRVKSQDGDIDVESIAPRFRGQAVYRFFSELLERKLKPAEDEDPSSDDWRVYKLLREYYVKGKEWGVVANDLGFARTSFFKSKDDAIGMAALVWWETAQRQSSGVGGNWTEVRAPYKHFVRRKDSVSNKYYDELILEELEPVRKAWVITLKGGPGVGKTALAYRVGTICYNEKLFDAIVGIKLNMKLLDPWTGNVLKTSQSDEFLRNFYDSLGIAIDERRVLTVPSLKMKKRIILDALWDYARGVLIVLDNLEVLLSKAQASAFQDIQSFFYDLPTSCKVLATSRGEPRVGEFQFRIGGMELEETLEFAQRIMQQRGRRPLPDDVIESIHESTGGSPLQIQRTIARIVSYGETPDEALQCRGQQELEYMYDDVPSRLNEQEKKILLTLLAVPGPVSIDGIAKLRSTKRYATELMIDELAFQTLVQEQTVVYPKGEAHLYEITPQFQTYLWKYCPEDKLLDSPIPAFLDQSRKQWAEHFYETLAYPPAFFQMEGQSVIDSRLLFLRYQKENVFYVMRWLYRKFVEEHDREAGVLFMRLMRLLGQPLGILGYKDKRIELGANASSIALTLGNERLAALFEVYDVIWSLRIWAVTDTDLVMQELRAHLGEAIKRWPVPGPNLVTRKLEANLEEATRKKWPEIEFLVRLQLGKHLRDEGLLTEALEQLEKSKEIFQSLGRNGKGEVEIQIGSWSVSVESEIGEAKLDMGNYVGARESFEAIVGLKHQDLSISRSTLAEKYCDLAWACRLGGDKDAAKLYLSEAERKLQGINLIASCWAHRDLREGQIDQLDRFCESARRNYKRAKEVLHKLGMERSARYKRVKQAIASLDRAE